MEAISNSTIKIKDDVLFGLKHFFGHRMVYFCHSERSEESRILFVVLDFPLLRSLTVLKVFVDLLFSMVEFLVYKIAWFMT